MKFTFFILISILLGCKTAQINIVDPAENVNDEIIQIDQSLERYVIHNIDLFKFDKEEFKGKDTLLTFENEKGQKISEGNYAINTKKEISRLKTGFHQTFYLAGKIKSEGDYKLGRYLNCCAGGLCQQYYNYKIGSWKYYYENSKLKAIVCYTSKKLRIDTSCEKVDTIMFGTIENIQLFDEDGTAQELTETDLNEFETVITEESEYTKISYYIDNDKVKWKLSY
ncbi:MAG: hypothetical protein H6615_10380 [Ignavibacteria bacterium]|nr:hypothetical protein [Ignavibacteria bacterium]